MMARQNILYHTFGCKLNFAETATLQQSLENEGFVSVSDSDTPDIVVINSCSVTEVADKKCRQYIRSVNRRFPAAHIVVTGCYAQLKGEEVSRLPGVAIVAGSDRKGELIGLIKTLASGGESCGLHITPTADIATFTPSCARGNRTRYFLKVQDGCDYRCSYCTIPRARGKSRSPRVAYIVEQARQVARDGGKEIVLTGVNIGDFGKGSSETFFDLVKALDEVEGIERFRISSIEPNLLTDEIIEFCARSRRFMPHFHIPLQSGSDEVLGLMRRRYRTSLFARRIAKVRELIPDAFIGIDLITGSRGETDAFFEDSYRFVDSLDISALHVFAYSERPGTDALDIPHKVSPDVQNERTHRMLALSDDKLRRFAERFAGSVRPVLLEHVRNAETMSGFTDNYLRVKVPADIALDNTIKNVRLERFDPEGKFFHGVIID